MFVTTIFDIFFVGGGEFYKLKTGIPGCFLGAYSSSIARLTQTLHKSDVSTISVFVRHGKGSDSSVDSSHRPTYGPLSLAPLNCLVLQFFFKGQSCMQNGRGQANLCSTPHIFVVFFRYTLNAPHRRPKTKAGQSP